MTLDQLLRNYPRVYHMANAGTWESVRERGLLSTTALLDLFGIGGQERYRIESCHRKESIEISHPQYGTVVIRDQAPMRESALETCLDGIRPRQWYELLNRKTFFWATEARVQTLLKARRYRDDEHIVITIETESLLAQHADRATLSPINSGSTLYNPPLRGAYTFQPITEYPFEQRRKMRGIPNAIAEIAVDYSVPDLVAHTIVVERRRRDEILEILYFRPR
jgi:uncharacterized protein DUF7002